METDIQAKSTQRGWDNFLDAPWCNPLELGKGSQFQGGGLDHAPPRTETSGHLNVITFQQEGSESHSRVTNGHAQLICPGLCHFYQHGSARSPLLFVTYKNGQCGPRLHLLAQSSRNLMGLLHGRTCIPAHQPPGREVGRTGRLSSLPANCDLLNHACKASIKPQKDGPESSRNGK